MLRGISQALNSLSIYATYCVIIAGASPRETKMWAAPRENCEFLKLCFEELGNCHPCNILRDNRKGLFRTNKNVGCDTWKVRFFCICSSNWETVQDRWVHAARGLASIELCFHSCNVLRDYGRGVTRANKQKWTPGYVKMTTFWQLWFE